MIGWLGYMAKILITGSSGFTGKNLYNKLEKTNTVVGISRTPSQTTDISIDISDYSKILDLPNISPDTIIHCSAFSNVDGCETDKILAWKSNVVATHNIVKYAYKTNANVIFTSTDYVYPGITGGYTEESIPNPCNFYGTTKLISENIIATLNKHCILRLTSIFGLDPGGKNFMQQLIDIDTKKGKKRIPVDQISNPISIYDVCDIVERCINKKITGLYNATGINSINRLQFANIIAKELNLSNIKIHQVNTSELHQNAQRPINNSTISRKLYSKIGFSPHSIKAECKRIRNWLHEN